MLAVVSGLSTFARYGTVASGCCGDVSSVAQDGSTALVLAADRGHNDVVVALVAARADVDMADEASARAAALSQL